MYYSHFGLKEPPFKITPNTEVFYTGGNRGAVLQALIYAINSGEGIIKVVGEVGSGKTMLCRMLQTMLPDKIESIYLANPSVAPEDILHAIAFELQLKLPKNADRLKVMQVLQAHLLARHAAGKQVVIFVEEAQGMPLATLEEIRLLSNLETKHDKLLQIVLFGQPELDDNLNQTNIRQLRERITHSFNLSPLKQQEIGEYLIFRLRAAGYFGPHLFNNAAIAKIADSALGLVRRVNILADKSLLAAYADNQYLVTPKHVKAAILDSEFGQEQVKVSLKKSRWWWIAALPLIGLGIGLAANRIDFFHALVKPQTIFKQAAPQAQFAAAVEAVESDLPAIAGTPVAEVADLPPLQEGPAVNQANLVESPAIALPATVDAMPVTITPMTSANGLTTEANKAIENTLPLILAQRLNATSAWLLSQPTTTVSIQLLGAASEAQIELEIERLSREIELDNIYVYRTKVNNLPFLTVLYGNYANRIEGTQALQKLPAQIQKNRPHLRTIAGVLQETK
ncbi:MAG: AAA family ATPase [Bdellovibrio sp.]|nr:AAA family ATPase [Methylotenera sp.]